MTTFLEDITDIPDPVGNVALGAPNPFKNLPQQVKELHDAVEDIRGVAAGPIFRSCKAFAPVPTTILDSGDVLTNWTAFPTASIDPSIKTTGTGSVKLPLRGNPSSCNGYLNVPGAPATAGKFRVVFDFRWAIRGIFNLRPGDVFEFFVASGANITGTVIATAIPYVTQGAFLSVSLPVTAIANLGSVGIRHRGAAFVTPTTTAGIDVWIDSVRWEATELDVALASAAGIVIPADYVSAVPQNTINLPPTKTVIDLRPATAGISRGDGVRSATEWGLYPNTGVDVSGLISYIIGQLLPGQTLVFAPGQYLVNTTLQFWLHNDIWIIAYGVRWYSNIENSNAAHVQVKSCQRVTVRGLSIFGYRTTLIAATASAWSSATAYVVGNEVSQGGVEYTCTAPNTNQVPPNGAFWNATTKHLASVASNRLSAQSSDYEDNSTLAALPGWAQVAGSALGDNTKISKSSNGRSFELHNPAVGGTATIAMTLPTGASAPIDVEPSTVYTPSAWFRPVDQPATYVPWAARSCEILVRWYTSGGSPASTPTATISGTETDQFTWKLVSGPVTSPADAAKMSLELRVVGTAGGAGALVGEAHAVDLIGVQRTTARALPVVGTAMQLTNPGDEARIATARVYARDKDLQIKVDFVLSDTVHIANDVEIIARDDETLELLAVKTIPVLTSTPTTYQHAYVTNPFIDQHNDLARLVRFSVRKTKATANTVTVTSATEYGKNTFDGTTESGAGIVVSDTDPATNYFALEDVLVEGVSGDGIAWTSGGNNCSGRRVMTRACQRQGFTVAGGADNGFEDWVSIGAGRSAMDWEPPASGRLIRRPYMRRGLVLRPLNAGIANGNWRLVEYGQIDGCVQWKCGVQSTMGGRWSTVRGVISYDYRGAALEPDLVFRGLHANFSDCIADHGWVMDAVSTSYIDDTGNTVSVTSSGNRGSNLQSRTGSAVSGASGDNYVTPVSSRGVAVAGAGLNSFVVPIAAQADLTYSVLVELGWHATYRVTARTTTSFTLETSVPAPVGGSSFNWTTVGV